MTEKVSKTLQNDCLAGCLVKNFDKVSKFH